MRNRLYFRNGADLMAADYQTEPRFSVTAPTAVIVGTFAIFELKALIPTE
jgi:hypothetical protein